MLTADYFTIPHAPDFLNDDFELVLTDTSKELFKRGRPRQGYIGIVELPFENEVTKEGKRQAKIHLLPADNKNSGNLYGFDKEGKPFPTLKSTQELGSFTGDLHFFATTRLGLGEKAGAKGYLIGFGIWKSGFGVKFLDELPHREALIPHEFLLIKKENKWSLYYTRSRIVMDTPECDEPYEMDINSYPGLQEALNRLPKKDVYKLDYEDRKPIETVLRTNSKDTETLESIGVIKNRSSSQNAFSIKKDDLFREFFQISTVNHNAHTEQFIREAPLPVLEKITNNMLQQLNLPVVPNLLKSKLIPGGLSGPASHLRIEDEWRKMEKKEREIELLRRAILLDDDLLVKDLIGKYKLSPEKLGDFTPELFKVLSAKRFKSAAVMLTYYKQINDYTVVSLLDYFVNSSNHEVGVFLLPYFLLYKEQHPNEILAKLKEYTLPLVKNGNIQMLDMLVENGVALDNPNLFIMALKNNDLTTIDWLIEKGVRPNQTNIMGASELWEAVRKRNYKYISYLLQNTSVDLEEPQEEGFTPLLYAVYNNDINLVKFLLDSGANPNVVGEIEDFNSISIDNSFDSFFNSNKTQKSALMIAEENNNSEIVSLLLSAQKKSKHTKPNQSDSARPSSLQFSAKSSSVSASQNEEKKSQNSPKRRRT